MLYLLALDYNNRIKMVKPLYVTERQWTMDMQIKKIIYQAICVSDSSICRILKH